MPNSYNATSTIRKLKHHGLVVRVRVFLQYEPIEFVNFFSITSPPGVRTSDILGKHVTYDKVDECYHLDPTESPWPPTHCYPFWLKNSLCVARLCRSIPCPRHQTRVDVEWRQGKWMKYLEHERGWRDV